MKSHRNYFGAVILGTLLIAQQGWGQSPTGNDNPTGVSGDYGGSITTGCNYDPYTGNAKRVIDDIVVPGAVGVYPLKWTRFLNTRDGGSHQFGSSGVWSHNYAWGLTIYDPHPWHCCDQWEGPDGVIYYPDGRRVDLWITDIPGEWDAYDSEGPRGMTHRVYGLGGGNYQLVMGDGGKVLFQTLSVWNGSYWEQGLFATTITDPYGLNTSLAYDYTGRLTQVTEPAGRYLQIYYGSAGISTVQAWDGRGNLVESVNYGYTTAWVYWEALNTWMPRTDLTQVYYDDGAVATYTWQDSNVADNTFNTILNRMVSTCDDPRYVGPMKRIKYEYVPHYGNPVGTWGQITAERNATTNQVVSRVTYPAYPDASVNRWETRGDGAQRHISASQLGWTDWTDFQGHTSYLNLFPPFDGWQFTDARSNTTSYERYTGTIGALWRITHPGDGSTRQFTYSDLGNPYYVTSVKDENDHWTSYGRDGNNRVQTITHPDGSWEYFSYNGFGQVVDHRLTSGGWEHFDYDYRGLKFAATDPFGNVTHYNYYWNDRLQTIVDPYGNATWFEYNQRGQVTKLTHQDGSYQASDYDAYGNKIWQEDELRHRTNFGYDEYGRVTTVTNPLNQTATMSYALDWSNPLIHTTNNPKYTLSPMGKNVVFGYDENMRKSYQVQALSTADEAWTWFGYDEVGNLSWTQDPRNNTTSFGYDARNRRTSVTDAFNQTTWCSYDGLGNKTSETRPDGTSQSWVYNDGLSRLTDHYGFAGERVAHYDRNTEHTWEWITDAKNATYAFTFDALHRKTAEYYPPDPTSGGRNEMFWYDAVGNLIQYKNPADDYKHFSYDSRHRERDSWWDWNGPWIHKDFDDASRMTNIRTNGGETTVTFGYDDANRKIWEDQTLAGYPTKRVGTDRDDDGNRANLYVPGYFGVGYSYSQRNQLTRIWDGSGNPFFDFGYDGNGNMTQRVSYWWYTHVSNYQYDAVNRVSMAEQGTNGWIFARSRYQYDSVNREVATWRDEQSSKGERYYYSNNDQLTNVRYNADQVWTGNPVNWNRWVDYGYTDGWLNRYYVNDNGDMRFYAAAGTNQYTGIWGSGLAYDGNFNLTWLDGVSFSYDAQNRLVDGNMQATYDGLGRCVRRTVNGNTTLYVYDDWKPELEFDQWNNLTAWMVYGSGADEILFRCSNAGGCTFYKQDARGNVMAMLDPGGNIIEKYSYDAFGRPHTTGWWDDNERGGSWYGNRYTFQGREWFPELGIYDYRNRYYQPYLGRFLQVDPMNFAAGDMNLFRYCDDDPVDHSDPTGLYAQGTGWTAETWAIFNTAQQQAAAALDKARAMTERALRGDPKSEAAKKEADAAKKAFEKVFGKGSATKENMREVAKTMHDMASALRDTHNRTANAVTDAVMTKNYGPGTLGHAWKNGRGIDINFGIRAFNDSTELTWTAAHESGHNFGLHDFALKLSARAPLPELPPSQALRNSDHVVQFGFTP